MKEKIEKEISGILGIYGELEVSEIANAAGLTYNNISKYLKRMSEEGKVERKAKKRKQEEGLFLGERNPWVYYYSLKKIRDVEERGSVGKNLESQL